MSRPAVGPVLAIALLCAGAIASAQTGIRNGIPVGAGHGAALQDVAPLMPRYLLMDVQGRAVSQEDFAGRLQLVSFGFISCPDVCPTTLLEVKHILDALGDKAGRLSSSPSTPNAIRARYCASTRPPLTRASWGLPASRN
jgi:cytochrome oxidase Cu insertion factor (SCO1/SenC/PrrC family)